MLNALPSFFFDRMLSSSQQNEFHICLLAWNKASFNSQRSIKWIYRLGGCLFSVSNLCSYLELCEMRMREKKKICFVLTVELIHKNQRLLMCDESSNDILLFQVTKKLCLFLS